MKPNDKTILADAWIAELERYEYDDEDFLTARCAELAEELDLFRIQALADLNFRNSFDDWDDYIQVHNLWLPLEQCCHDGVLLPMDQRALRVKSCPEEVLSRLRWFFSFCPAHVRHRLALTYWVVVRIERARRTGNPEWRPATAEPRSPFHDTVFFRPPVLTVRKYTG
ncbi:MAG: hypothetical protein WCH44_07090 [Betaproteobacteria bacterium]